MESGVSAEAQPPADWRMYSGTDDQSAYYSVPSLMHEKSGYVRVWAEILNNDDVHNVVASLGARTADIVISRLKAGYIPPFVLMQQVITPNETVNVALAEEVANERLAPIVSLFLNEVDCAKKRTRFLQWTDYSSDGSPLQSRPRSSAWQSAGPHTVGETLLTFVCKPQIPLPAPSGSQH